MAAVDLKALIGRLDEPCRRALEAAAGLTLSRTHYNVEIEHWLLKLADTADGDVASILRHYEVDQGRLLADLNRALDRMKTGNARAPSLSPEVVELAREAWLMASIEHNLSRLRSGHLLWALLADETLARRARETSGQLMRIPAEALKRDFAAVTADSSEAPGVATAPESAPPVAAGPGSPAGAGALGQFTIDLTALARAGKIDPILGRDSEIRQIIDILTRRRQNNPILTGEAGVGKTAVVEGFAHRVAQGDVPPTLREVAVRTLDLGLLQAGAGVRGEFENRLKGVIEEVKASPRPVILFIDEAHTLVGAGAGAGQGDAANLLKPALARSELRTIAATTWAEYKKYFEKDAALTRRFQVVKVEEPGEAAAIAMVRGLVATLEEHHKVRILDEAVGAAVRLSARYIPSRQLPDKAVSLIDTACARVAMSQSAVPAAIEDRQRQIAIADTELAILDRETATGGDHAQRRAELFEERARAAAELDELCARWREEKGLATAIAAARQAIENPAASVDRDADKDAARARLAETMAQLRAVQGECPLIFPVVDAQAVAEIVESWTGIPAGRMQSDEIRTVLHLKEAIEKRIIGQPQALEAVAQAIVTSRAGLTDPRKPIGVFLLVGQSGTGKTETALSLAELLYGGEQHLTVINMSEFKEEHKVSLLMGSPPGYVGYGEGGVLTEAVRRRPYSVILLDEMEKAHPGVQDIFYQVFDKGMMRDGEGRDIDFKNTVIIMTSNAGSELIDKLYADPETAPDATGLGEALRPELLKFFKPAFLGRVRLVPYLPLSDAVIRRIVELQLARVRDRVFNSYRAAFEHDPALVEAIAARCTETASGARNVEKILSGTLLPELSAEILARLAEGRPISRVEVGMDPAGLFCYTVK
ncbi:MAG TPA: type VI secretion system ATPase TssH [Stellaceae bacterium]